MPIFYAQYRARPDAKAAANLAHGGAYVNCWIRSDGPDEAGRIAARDIAEAGWVVECVEEPPRIESTPSESNAGYFDQAMMDGECYVFHTWPVGDHDVELSH